jgi:putative transposase
MKKSQFSEEQIIGVLHEWSGGAKVAELIRRYGVTEQTLYRWRKKYGGLQDPSRGSLPRCAWGSRWQCDV